MAWIELHQAVWTHRKTFELAAVLGLTETYAAAHLLRLWCWALDNAPDGNLAGVSDRAIARGADWSGDSELFVQALLQAGWLDADRAIHDWEQYAGRLIDRREANAERMRKARANRVEKPDETRAAHVQRTCDESVQLPDHTGPNRTLTGPDHQPKSFPDGKDLAAGAAGNGRERERPSGVPSDVIAALSGLPNDLDARAFHDLAHQTLEGLGFTCRNEIPVANRGDGRPGRYDLRAERDGMAIAFEFDDRTPRKYSGIKLASVDDAVRVIVLRCPFEGPLPSVPNIDAVIGAGRALVPSRNGFHRNGRAATAVMEPPSADDEALWALAVEQIAGDGDGPAWRSNVENWIRPLTVAGRGPTGGLQLRAPPGGKSTAQRFWQVIVQALITVGDPHPRHVAIVE